MYLKEILVIIWRVREKVVNLRGELNDRNNMKIIDVKKFAARRDRISELIQNFQWVEAFSCLLQIIDEIGPLRDKSEYSDEECDFLFRIYYNLFISGWNAKSTDKEILEYGEIAIRYTSRRDCLHKVYYELTVHAIQKEKLEQASEYITKSLEYADTDEQKAYSYKYCAVLNLRQHNPNEALSQYMQAAYYAEEAQMNTFIPFIYIELVNVWYELGKTEIALNNAEKAIQLAQKSGQYSIYIRAKVKKAQLLYHLGRDFDAKKEVLDIEFAID